MESKKLLKVLHHAKWDYQVLKRVGIVLENVYDTMLVEQLLDNGHHRPKGYFTLEETHLRHTGFNPYGEQLSLFDPYVPKKIRTEIAKIGERPLTTEEIFYAATDTETVIRIRNSQLKLLAQQKREFDAEVENEFVLCLGDMEFNGMPVNNPRWLELAAWSRERMETQLAKLKEYKDINWNSHPQKKKYFKELGMSIDIFDPKSGTVKESVGEEVIEKYSRLFPVVKEYIAYTHYAKLSGTYGEKFLRYLSPETGRIHSSFLQIKHTGRISSTKPNLQNIVRGSVDFPEGKWWREAFEAPEGRTFIIADYSKQEVACAAEKSRDEVLIKFLKEGLDLHRLTASALFEIPQEQVSEEQRGEAKTSLFAALYGAGVDKLMKQFKVTKAKAAKMQAAIFENYPRVVEFQNASFKASMKNGYILVDDITGRRCYIDNYAYIKELERLKEYYPKYGNEYKKLTSKVFRDSSNYPLQGLGASITKYASILIRRKLGVNDKLILNIHDEIIVECDVQNSLVIKEIVEECMKQSVARFCKYVDIPAEAKISKKWSK